MAWIESHQSLARHPKTLKLAAELGCGVPAAIGYVHLLWYWALDYAHDGEIEGRVRVLVAKECEWRGKAEIFWMALLEAGFVEPSEAGMRIHDWMDYAGRLLDKRDANRARSKRARNAKRTPLPTNQQTEDADTRSASSSPTPPKSPNGDAALETASRRAPRPTPTVEDAIATLYGPRQQIERLPNGAQQCPLCPEIFTCSYSEHLDSPRHKVRAEPDDLSTFHA